MHLQSILETTGTYISGKKSFFPSQLVNFWLFGLIIIYATFSKIIRKVVIQACSFKFTGKNIPGMKSTSLNVTRYYNLSSPSGDKTSSLLTFWHSFSKLFDYKVYEIKNVRFSKYIRIIILRTNDCIYNLTGLLNNRRIIYRIFNLHPSWCGDFIIS